jgi:hypothetical protein
MGYHRRHDPPDFRNSNNASNITDEWPFAVLRMRVRSTVSRKPAGSMIEPR